MGALAIGVPIPWARAGPADFTPLAAMVGAILILRFIVGARLTVMTTMLAITAGALWSYCAERWGIVLPTMSALVLIVSLRSSIAHSRSL
jgi:hypothetical protein